MMNPWMTWIHHKVHSDVVADRRKQVRLYKLHRGMTDVSYNLINSPVKQPWCGFPSIIFNHNTWDVDSVVTV